MFGAHPRRTSGEDFLAVIFYLLLMSLLFLKGWSNGFFRRLDCVYGEHSNVHASFKKKKKKKKALFFTYFTCIVHCFSASINTAGWFTFMHLADAFIQSDLQCIQAIHVFFLSLWFPGSVKALPQKYTMGSDWLAGPVCCDWLNHL